VAFARHALPPQLNLIKSRIRTRMLPQLLNDLLMIRLNGPECEGMNSADMSDILEKAYGLWQQRKKRLPKKSRTDARPERRKKSHKEPGLEIEREKSEDDDNDYNDEGCVCEGGGTGSPVLSTKYFMTFSDRQVLIPPPGYTVMDVSETCDLSDVSIRTKMLLSGRDKGGKIGLQLSSGWITNGVIAGICRGECPHHSLDKKDWVWVRFAADDEFSSLSHLCELDHTYGQDSENSWCILLPDLMETEEEGGS